MSTSNFNLRGIPSEVMLLLKREAKRLHTSINGLMLKMIEQGLGMNTQRQIHHDLDHLASSWSDSEAQIFKENIKGFEQVERDLWK